ncbi:MAG TPA: NAD(P)-binding domain-containing protein [Anaerolineales bacterium]|nr:NAD(P)-binding domain-containing protein [Anaerolineales bacterium]HEX5837009.1 NAD(P)-binding domain-containing protein [Anaerolineales bacterium]
MQIGVLGSGVTGQTIGSKLVQLGHEVMLGSRDEANPPAVAWAKDAGGQHALYGTFMNAASFGEIIFNCTLGAASLDALQQAGAENLKGKILIDTSNPLDRSTDMWTLTICNEDSLGEQIQRAFPETKVVKTLNTVNANVMVDPAKLLERTHVFVSGDDIEAKATVVRILRDWFGWKEIIDLGGIETARGVEMYVLLWHNLRNAISSQRFNIKIVTS